MRIRFLGTAAAEGIPALWCDCDCCRRSRELGGRNIRHRCSYCIDSDTLVDFGPDSFCRTLDCGINLAFVKRLIVTHPHSDHLLPDDFLYRSMPRFCGAAPAGNMDLLCSREVLHEFLRGVMNSSGAGVPAQDPYGDMRLAPILLTGGEWVRSGDVEVLPIPATHAPGLGAMILAIRRGGKTVLIANDTAPLAETSWAMLDGVKLDLAVIECTTGFRHPDASRSHMGVNTTLRFRDRLLEMGCLAPETLVYVTHFSHNGGGTHEELSRFFEPHGISVAWDGLAAEV